VMVRTPAASVADNRRRSSRLSRCVRGMSVSSFERGVGGFPEPIRRCAAAEVFPAPPTIPRRRHDFTAAEREKRLRNACESKKKSAYVRRCSIKWVRGSFQFPHVEVGELQSP